MTEQSSGRRPAGGGVSTDDEHLMQYDRQEPIIVAFEAFVAAVLPSDAAEAYAARSTQSAPAPRQRPGA